MRYYQTKQQQVSNKTKTARQKKEYNIIFNDDERLRIAKLYPMLLELKLRLEEAGLLNGWNDYDREALEEILLWPQPYSRGGKMNDLTPAQVDKINRMFRKLSPDEPMTVQSLFELDFDPGWNETRFMTEHEMLMLMNEKRNAHLLWRMELNSPLSRLFDRIE